MVRSAKLIIVGLLLVMASSTDASAKDWWAWLEEFSGPGSFRATNGWQNRHLTFACHGREVEHVWTPQGTAGQSVITTAVTGEYSQLFGTPVWKGQRSAGKGMDGVKCLYFENTSYRSEDDARGFPPMNADTFEFGFSVQLPGPFDLGAGAGAIRLATRDGEHVEWRPNVTAFRLQVRPLFIVDRGGEWWRRVANAPKFYVKMSAVFGTLQASDFGVTDLATTASGFRTGGDMVASYGFVLDYGELLALIPKFR